jgi:methylmalonyl-CoA/ethylmalonyl-CoA epimerase
MALQYGAFFMAGRFQVEEPDKIIRKEYLKLIGINKIDHICIAVCDLPKAIKQWGPFFGKGKPDLEYTHEDEAIQVARYYVGEVGFELMCSTREGSDVDNFIKKRGEGVMLISFKVPDTVSAIETLKNNDYEMIDQKPRLWEDSRYAFLKPGPMNGVLVEVIDGGEE